MAHLPFCLCLSLCHICYFSFCSPLLQLRQGECRCGIILCFFLWRGNNLLLPCFTVIVSSNRVAAAILHTFSLFFVDTAWKPLWYIIYRLCWLRFICSALSSVRKPPLSSYLLTYLLLVVVLISVISSLHPIFIVEYCANQCSTLLCSLTRSTSNNDGLVSIQREIAVTTGWFLLCDALVHFSVHSFCLSVGLVPPTLLLMVCYWLYYSSAIGHVLPWTFHVIVVYAIYPRPKIDWIGVQWHFQHSALP